MISRRRLLFGGYTMGVCAVAAPFVISSSIFDIEVQDFSSLSQALSNQLRVAFVFMGAMRRIEAAIDLLEREQIDLIVFLSPPRDHEKNYIRSITAIQNQYEILKNAESTREEALNLKRWLDANNVQSIQGVIVTDDWHMQRCLHELRNVLPKDFQVIKYSVMGANRPDPMELLKRAFVRLEELVYR